MEMELSPDQELFAKTTRRFLESQDLPADARRLHEQGGGFDHDYWRRGAELGWTAMLVPEALGGGSISGHGLLDLTLVAEEMGRLIAPGPLLATNVVIEALSCGGAGEHEKLIGRLLSGEATATWAFDEGGDRWDAAGVRLTARSEGEGWLLDGTAAFVLDAPSADVFLVSARTAGGLTQFLVPATAAGVTVSPRTSLDLVRQIGDVTFTGATASAVVGAVDQAADEVERQLRTAIVLQNAETAGALERVFAMTLAYSRDRVAFGRPIGSYQAIKHRFASLKMALEACQATAGASARAVAEDLPNAAELVAVAKSFIADQAPAMVQDCVQIHGGIGVTWEHDLHLYLRRVTQNAMLFGGVRQHRERLAAQAGM